MREAKAQAGLCICAYSSEPSLLDNAISTSISCTDLDCSTLKLPLYTVGKKLSLVHDKL